MDISNSNQDTMFHETAEGGATQAAVSMDTPLNLSENLEQNPESAKETLDQFVEKQKESIQSLANLAEDMNDEEKATAAGIAFEGMRSAYEELTEAAIMVVEKDQVEALGMIIDATETLENEYQAKVAEKFTDSVLGLNPFKEGSLEGEVVEKINSLNKEVPEEILKRLVDRIQSLLKEVNDIDALAKFKSFLQSAEVQDLVSKYKEEFAELSKDVKVEVIVNQTKEKGGFPWLKVIGITAGVVTLGALGLGAAHAFGLIGSSGFFGSIGSFVSGALNSAGAAIGNALGLSQAGAASGAAGAGAGLSGSAAGAGAAGTAAGSAGAGAATGTGLGAGTASGMAEFLAGGVIAP